jgi:hypothetical protein
MPQRTGETRVEAGREPFPTDGQAAVLALEPGTRPLGLGARNLCVDRPSPRLAARPHALRNLGADPALTATTAAVFRLGPLLRRQDQVAFARSTPVAGADVEGIQPRDDWRPLIPLGGRRARRQRPASRVCEAGDEEPFAVAARGDTLTPACARGNTRPPRPRTATESSRVPRLARIGALAWPRASPRPASAAATDAPRSGRPIDGRGGAHPNGSR